MTKYTRAKESRYGLTMIAGQLFDFAFGSYMLMLSMGGLHHNVWPQLPAVSFTNAMLILWAAWQFIPVGVFKLNGVHYMLERHLGYKESK